MTPGRSPRNDNYTVCAVKSLPNLPMVNRKKKNNKNIYTTSFYLWRVSVSRHRTNNYNNFDGNYIIIVTNRARRNYRRPPKIITVDNRGFFFSTVLAAETVNSGQGLENGRQWKNCRNSAR